MSKNIVAATVLVALVGALVAEARHAQPEQALARTLHGTWRVEITLRNCQTGDALGVPFPAMATFDASGTVITSDGGLGPATRGAGHGIWRRSAAHTYAVLTEAFLFAPDGARSGTQRLRQSIEIGWDPDEFTATVSAEVLNLQGALLFSGCATSMGRRMQ
jgi:hypothetical protein